MTTNQPFKSERHAALASEDRATEQAMTARQIARVLGPVPRTRRARPGCIVRAIRAVLAWL